MDVRELWHISDTDSELRKIQTEPGANLLIVQSEYSLISSGTEKIVSKGLVPMQIGERMKVPYMKGNFPNPVSYGYSLVGKVIEGPKTLMNRHVHILHPHHDFAFVEEQDVFLIPDDIPSKRAVFASNMETVVNAIWDSKPQLGDQILIAGFGTIGALLALTISQYPRLDIKILENNPKRRKIAKECGLETIDADKDSHTEFDISYHCTGKETGLQFCIDHTKTEGKIIELSWYGNKSVNIDLGKTFHTGRKKIISSQVSQIPNDKNSSWNFKTRKELVFKLLQNNIYDKLPVLEIPFADSPDFFKKLRNEFICEPSLIIRY